MIMLYLNKKYIGLIKFFAGIIALIVVSSAFYVGHRLGGWLLDFILFCFVSSLISVNYISWRKITESEELAKALEKKLKEQTAQLKETLRQQVIERKNAEIAFRSSQTPYRLLFEQAADSIAVIEVETGMFVIFNQRACEKLGYQRKEFEALTISDIDSDFLKEKYKTIMESGLYVFETRHKTKNGNLIDVLVNASYIEIQGKRFIQSIWHDISERKQIENRLKESEFKYRTLVETANDAIFIADAATGIILDVNKSAEKLIGLPCNKIIGMHQTELHPVKQSDLYTTMFKAHAEGGNFTESMFVRNREGKEIPVEVSASSFEIGGKRVVQGIFRDITERRRTEESLMKKDAILEAINLSCEMFLSATAWELRINEVLERFGRATFSNRVYIYKLNKHGDKPPSFSIQFEWLTNNLKPFLGDPKLSNMPINDNEILVEWGKLLDKDEIIYGNVVDFSEKKQKQLYFLEPTLKSFILVPIFVDNELTGEHVNSPIRWGGLGFNLCNQEREWSGIELEVLKSAANIFGAGISRRNMEQAILEQKERAELASKYKSEFLANMSHEIRTPMNAIIGMNNLLIKTQMSSIQMDYAQTVKSSSELLLAIINDILDFSKIEAGRIELEMMDFNLKEVLQTVMELFTTKAKEKNLEMLLLIYPNVPILLCGDPWRLQQILNNLVGNAIKFTHKGEVVLRVTLEEETQDKTDTITIKFSITDTGIGISKNHMDRLFKSFSQVDASINRRYGGTGLGLAISKRLVELMKGTIGVQSDEGNGSTFWFTVKFAKSKINANETSQYSMPKSRLTKEQIQNSKILLVEDNESNRKLAISILKFYGFAVDVAKNGKEAIQMLEKISYDIVLMDIHMPKMNGLQATQIIRGPSSNVINRNVPIIAITAFALKEDRERCIAAGMNDFLVKPIKEDELLYLIEKYIKYPKK